MVDGGDGGGDWEDKPRGRAGGTGDPVWGLCGMAEREDEGRSDGGRDRVVEGRAKRAERAGNAEGPEETRGDGSEGRAGEDGGRGRDCERVEGDRERGRCNVVHGAEEASWMYCCIDTVGKGTSVWGQWWRTEGNWGRRS